MLAESPAMLPERAVAGGMLREEARRHAWSSVAMTGESVTEGPCWPSGLLLLSCVRLGGASAYQIDLAQADGDPRARSDWRAILSVSLRGPTLYLSCVAKRRQSGYRLIRERCLVGFPTAVAFDA
jgi:hypothetical protein